MESIFRRRMIPAGSCLTFLLIVFSTGLSAGEPFTASGHPNASGQFTASDQPNASGQFTASDLLELRSVGGLEISPDGTEYLYAVYTPRGPNEKPGGRRVEYLRAGLEEGSPVPLFREGFRASSPAYSPDGKWIGFLYAEGEDQRQVWAMPARGGEMFRLTSAPSGVSSFRWQPEGRGLAYLSGAESSEREKQLEERGYDFIFYEENLKNNQLFYSWYDENWKQVGLWQLTGGMNAWDFTFNHQGTQIAVTLSPENLIDHRYMFRKIYVVDLESGEMKQVSRNEGKLGNYQFNPSGTHLAYNASLHLNDHKESQVYMVDLGDLSVVNLTPPDFRGHVNWVSWTDDRHVLYRSGEGVYPTLSTVPLKGGEREVILNAADIGLIFSNPEISADGSHFYFTADTPEDPGNIYHWDGKNEPERLTDLNPALRQKELGKQEVIRFQARDGMEIEGLVIHPLEYTEGESYPLIVYVHGGPESHHSNGWLSRYSTPGQVMAGKGYLVMYLNYRASTGYGVDFGMEGFMDPAGKEFDDIADGIEWAVTAKGADPERVGMAGGSYGGYASGWFATYYTRYVKAVCMFVGVSNNISRRGTTDIPYEELYVHSGKPLEEQWQLALERSPVYWAHQSRTATLIYGGAADTRVHPSQSLELYRRMKMNDHPAVRLVQYPGEGHGNRKQVGQIDVLYRQMEWFDWYVRDQEPLDGPMPRLDISDRYGLNWNL